MRPLLLIFLLLTSLSGSASLAEDSSFVLTFDAYMDRVKEHHPMAFQAEIQLDKGDATLQESRGGFDPKLQSDWSQKNFDGKNYYSLFDGGLKVPTWYGIEVQGGYEQNEGVFLNPENNMPGAGLWYAGVSVPIGRDLFIDERRAMFRQAEIYRESTKIERQKMYNELLFSAGKAYWDWFQAYNIREVYLEALTIAQQRAVATKQSAFLGDRPFIDTLEVSIQLQNRQLSLQQAQLDYDNAAAKLAIYMWVDGQVPLELEENTVPLEFDSLIRDEVTDLFLNQMDTFVENHPDLLLYRFKRETLRIDQRFRREQLKPQLDLKYNALTAPINGDPFAEYTTNNYNWGVQFEFPIFLRKERGKLRQIDLKMQEIEFEITAKRASTRFKAIAAINQWQTALQQIELYTGTVEDYRQLLNGERRMFDAGESSVFMVNSREWGYIKAQLKLVELSAKVRKVSLQTRYSFGLLGAE